MTTRRVVTGIDADGKSYFVHDGPTPTAVDVGIAVLEEVWIDDPAKPDPENMIDPIAIDRVPLVPPAGGSVIRVGTVWPADKPGAPSDDISNLAEWDAGHAMEDGDEGWHTTATIDYGIVISGNIELGLDSGWVTLGPGDIVVQRATRHAWRHVGDEPCRIAWVLISSANYT